MDTVGIAARVLSGSFRTVSPPAPQCYTAAGLKLHCLCLFQSCSAGGEWGVL